MLTRLFLSGVLILLNTNIVLTQNYTADVRHYSIEDGLSHREAHCIFQDDSGFIWIGTKKGLNRFDGYDFKTWTREEYGYDFNRISRIGQDDGGWLWLWNDKSLLFLHSQTLEIRTIEEHLGTDIPFETQLKTLGSWKYWNIRQIFRDGKGKLYIKNNQPTQIITYTSQDGLEVIPLEELSDIEIKCVTKTGKIWLSSPGKLLKLDLENNDLETYTHYHPEDEIDAVYELPNGIIYRMTTSHAMPKWQFYTIIDGQQKRLEQLPPANLFHFNHVFEQILIPTDNQWNIYNLNQELVGKIADDDSGYSLYLQANHSLTDINGNTWLADDFGLTFISFREQYFQKYFHYVNETNRPYNNSARGMAVDEGQLYVNFEMGGLTQINMEQPNDWTLLDRTLGISQIVETDGRYSYWGRPILTTTSIFENGQTHFWVGSDGGLRLYQTDGKLLKEYPLNNPFSLWPQKDIWALYEQNPKKMWIGTGNGLSFKNANEDYIQTYAGATGRFSLKDAIVYYFAQENEQWLWICTSIGLFQFDQQKEKIVAHFSASQTDDHYIPVEDARHLLIAKDGIFWLATTEGLVRWDRTSNDMRVFTTKEGLPNNLLVSAYEDEQNNLWISTDRGIAQMNTTDFSMRVFLTNEGNLSGFNRISHLQAEDGRIFFGSMNGVVAFNPADFYKEQKEVNANLVVTNYQHFEGSTDTLQNRTGEIPELSAIVFQPEDRFIRLDFSLLYFDDPLATQYAYKIEGLDKDWQYLKDRSLQLNRLPYGDYTLKVKAKASGLTELEKEWQIPIQAIKPIYLQNWFITVAFLGLLLLAFLAYQWRTARLKQQQKQLEKAIKVATQKIEQDKTLIEQQAEELRQLNATKDRLFAIIGHDLRKPALAFRGISKKVNFLIQQNDFDTLHQFGQQLDRAAFSMNNLLDNLLNWALKQRKVLPYDPKVINVQEATTEIYALFEEMANEKGIDLQLKIAPSAQVFSDPNAFATIVRNLLDNAIKYTPKNGVIQLKAIPSTQEVKLIVEDTGVGITADKLEHLFDLEQNKSSRGTAGETGSGLGLNLVKDLVELNRGTIKVISELHKGTRFEVLLPGV